MSVQLSVKVRNARIDAIEAQIGTAPILELRTGAQPADCAQAGSGSLLAQFALPSDWQAAAAAGAGAKAGTWSGTGVGAGAAAHFRILRSGSPSECDIQGSVTATGGGGDMTLDNVNIAIGQTITVNSFNLTDANA